MDVDELRDNWKCPVCGCGWCVPRGKQPDEKAHSDHGEYVMEGPCSCSPDHPGYEPEPEL